jgi:hypothetical protein
VLEVGEAVQFDATAHGIALRIDEAGEPRAAVISYPVSLL